MSFSSAYGSAFDVEVEEPPIEPPVFPPIEPPEPVEPTATEEERLTQAIIAKATRILLLAATPLGLAGEISEFGVATVRPDYQIQELLYGLRNRAVLLELSGLVQPDDVIRAGLMVDPAGFPTDRIPDVQRAIYAAEDWITSYLYGAFGVA